MLRFGWMRFAIAIVAVAGLGVAPGGAAKASQTVYFQDFETDTAGWTDGGSYGSITRVNSGVGGISSFNGNFHAVVTQNPSGPYTFFDGNRSSWPGQFVAQIAIYLNPGMADGEGFDYSVAASRTNGSHLRDFIFHVAKDISTGSLLVGASNNSNFNPRQDLETIGGSVVGTAGWYLFEHVFRDDNGVLAVDLNVRDTSNSLIFTKTLSTPTDLIGSVGGGNRYGWFTNIDVTGGIAIDNASLTLSAVPEPGLAINLAGAFVVGAGYLWLRRRRGDGSNLLAKA